MNDEDEQVVQLHETLDEVVDGVAGMTAELQDSATPGSDLERILNKLKEAHSALEESQRRVNEAMQKARQDARDTDSK